MMLVDCESCPVRDHHCADCMVTALTRLPLPALRPVAEVAAPGAVPLDPQERRAVAVLLSAGLVDPEVAERASATLEPTPGRRHRAAG